MIFIETAENINACDIALIESEAFSEKRYPEDIIRLLENPAYFCLIARKDTLVKGYIMVSIASDEADIIDIAVKKDSRRMGIAKKLIEKALSVAKERAVKTIYLEVRESNFAAKSLYLKFGFSEIGKRRAYYKKPTEDAILMSKTI